jgi:NMD protein affecting ribosome stability and mRNA decay
VSTHDASSSDATPRRKSVLFCPDCGHESGFHGDWIREDHASRTTHTCPVCETTVENRHRPDPLPAS